MTGNYPTKTVLFAFFYHLQRETENKYNEKISCLKICKVNLPTSFYETSLGTHRFKHSLNECLIVY